MSLHDRIDDLEARVADRTDQIAADRDGVARQYATEYADVFDTGLPALLAAVQSHAMRLGEFDRVAGHEPRNAPGRGVSCVFWLDDSRAHDRNLIAKVETYLKDQDTAGLDIRILPPVEAIKFSLERIRKGLRRTYQSSLLFKELSVRDNLLFGFKRTPPAQRRHIKGGNKPVYTHCVKSPTAAAPTARSLSPVPTALPPLGIWIFVSDREIFSIEGKLL